MQRVVGTTHVSREDQQYAHAYAMRKILHDENDGGEVHEVAAAEVDHANGGEVHEVVAAAEVERVDHANGWCQADPRMQC
jgi:hypothetical protein